MNLISLFFLQIFPYGQVNKLFQMDHSVISPSLIVLLTNAEVLIWGQQLSHWQESRSQKISRTNDSLFSRSLEKNEFSFLFLFSIFKIFRKKFYFSSRFVRFLNPFSFSSWFSRFLRKISLSLLDWWDSETQISFSSRFSRYLEKILFLFSIYEIFENNSLSLLNFQGF